jgi:hypothetical protein
MTTKTYETTTDEVECLYCFGHGRISVVSAYSRSFNDCRAEEACTRCAGTGSITVTITADEWREADEWLAEQEEQNEAVRAAQRERQTKEAAEIAVAFNRIEAELDRLTGAVR